nr:hypothetical protein [Tanacetum cinerariifolium]
MDLFNLISAPNPTKVKTGSRPRAAHGVPLLTVTANRVIEMEDPAAATDSSGVPSTIESPAERVAATDPPAVKERHKRGHDGVDTNALPKVLRRDHADPRPTESTRGGKSLAAIELGMGSTRPTPAPQGAPVDVSDHPVSLSFNNPQSRPWQMLPNKSSKGASVAGDPESENTSFASMVGSPESIYRPEWGITNDSMLDTPEACQYLVDHVAMGSQLRLRFEQKAKLLKKSVAQVARRDKRIQAIENEIKNLETLLEAAADIKKAAEN